MLSFMIDVTVKVCDDDQTLTEKFVVYDQLDSFTISHDDPRLKGIVESTIAKFKGKATDVVVKVKYTW